MQTRKLTLDEAHAIMLNPGWMRAGDGLRRGQYYWNRRTGEFMEMTVNARGTQGSAILSVPDATLALEPIAGLAGSLDGIGGGTEVLYRFKLRLIKDAQDALAHRMPVPSRMPVPAEEEI